ncbi:MFS transporter [Streptomyces sp.]|uniref:MFS transporter n=1 Tax=Streptomyces sp. TaxID=1931 RepID=UPI0025F22BB7|nr:MFS transporter [Streptomyces sp.]
MTATEASEESAAGEAPAAGGAPAAAPPRRFAGLRRQALDLRPLAIPEFRRLAVGQGAAFVGAMLTQTAVPVQVYALSHSSLAVGMVGFVGLVPLICFGLYGGAIADAVDRRKLYLWSSVGTLLVTIGLLAQAVGRANSVGLILALVFVQAALFAVSSSTRGAIVPRIVPKELVPAANTFTFTVSNVGQVLGPIIAGVLVGRHNGFAYSYGIDALLFLAALYSAFRLPDLAPVGRTSRPGLRSIGEGLAFIAKRPVLLTSFAMDIVAMVLASPRSLYPAMAQTRYHGLVGPLYAAIAIGAVLAGSASGWIGRVRRQGAALTGAIVLWGAAVALAGLVGSLWLVVALLALAGAADLVSSVFRQTILQTYAPDELRGRMQGVFIVVVNGGPRLGDVRAGGIAAVTTVSFSWVSGGLACIAVAVLLGFFSRSFWRYDTRQPVPVDASGEPDRR